MSIPNPFRPVCGKADGRLPYLPGDIPCRAAVLEGVWDGKLASTGSTGTVYDPTRGRYLYDVIAGLADEVLSVVVVARESEYTAVMYNSQGAPRGAYKGVGFFDVNRKEHFADNSRFDKNIYAPLTGENTVYGVENGALFNADVRIFGNTIDVPERANKIFTGTDTFCCLFFNRTLTESEALDVITYIESKK